MKIRELLDELNSLRWDAELRARDLLRSDEERIAPRSAADAYAYCIMRIRELNKYKRG